jgi:WD40 repeat protein
MQLVRRCLFGDKIIDSTVASLPDSGSLFHILHSVATDYNDVEKRRRVGRSVNTKIQSFHRFHYGVLQDENLNLVEVGYNDSKIYVALKDSIQVLDQKTNIVDDPEFPQFSPWVFDVASVPSYSYGQPALVEDLETVTSLKWGEGADHAGVAVGSFGKVRTLTQLCTSALYEWTNHEGYVTGLEWMGPSELAAASDRHVKMHDLRNRCNTLASSLSLDCSDQKPVTKLAFQKDTKTLACAGNGMIRLWDIRHTGHGPLHTLRHDDVRGLQFCPLEPNKLATGGKDGVKLWNTVSGKIANEIPMPRKTVSNLLWSPNRKEVVVSHGHRLSVWSLSSLAAARQLEDWSLPCDADPTGSKVLSLAQMSKNANGKVVSLHSNGIVATWDAFGPTPLKNKEKTFMDCNMPAFGVIR